MHVLVFGRSSIIQLRVTPAGEQCGYSRPCSAKAPLQVCPGLPEPPEPLGSFPLYASPSLIPLSLKPALFGFYIIVCPISSYLSLAVISPLLADNFRDLISPLSPPSIAEAVPLISSSGMSNIVPA